MLSWLKKNYFWIPPGLLVVFSIGLLILVLVFPSSVLKEKKDDLLMKLRFWERESMPAELERVNLEEFKRFPENQKTKIGDKTTLLIGKLQDKGENIITVSYEEGTVIFSFDEKTHFYETIKEGNAEPQFVESSFEELMPNSSVFVKYQEDKKDEVGNYVAIEIGHQETLKSIPFLK